MVKTLDDRIEVLIRTIREDARREIEELRAETDKKEAEILAEGKLRAEKLRSEILEKAKLEALARKEEALAELKLEEKKMMLERREALINEVFESVKDEIPILVNKTDYAQFLPGLVKEAVLNLETDRAVLHFDTVSRGLISEPDIEIIGDEIKTQLTVGDDIYQGNGVIVTDRAGHRVYDNTLQTRLERDKELLRAKIFRILMEETK